MKKIILLTLCMFVLINITNGQYQTNKMNYNVKDYSHQQGDPYIPAIAGITSFFVPGLGQMLSDEFGRGIVFLGSYIGVAGVTYYKISLIEHNPEEIGDYTWLAQTLVISMIGGAGIAIVITWATIDAVRVAKINSMASRDSNKPTGLSLNIQPYIGTNLYNNSIPVGMTFQFTF